MSAFERFGRKAAKEIGPFVLIAGVSIGLVALAAQVPLVAQAAWGIVAITITVAAVSALVSIAAMLWAVLAPIGRWMRPYLPVRVWQVDGPPGGGPWLHKPAEAAEFIRDEREHGANDEHLTKEERRSYRNAPDFTPTELKPLWFPGRKVERSGWSIQCRLIQAKELDQEWDGW